MLNVDEKPETIHLYVVRDETPKPSPFAIFIPVLALLVVAALCTLLPYQQPVTRIILRVAAIPLAIKTFTVQTAIIPTGVRVYPATTGHGTLTITHGSIIGQSIPAGFAIQGVVTDHAVYVPGGNANGYGWAQVTAHAGIPGKNGNIPAYAINNVIGSSVYVRNLSAFTGGKDSYEVKFATTQDKQTALIKARNILAVQINGLHYPCTEYVNSRKPYVDISINWRCQFVTYHIPVFYHVTGVKIIGENLLIDVWFVMRPMHIWVK